MKNRSGNLSFGIQGKISVYFVLFSSYYSFFSLNNLFAGNFFTSLKPTILLLMFYFKRIFNMVIQTPSQNPFTSCIQNTCNTLIDFQKKHKRLWPSNMSQKSICNHPPHIYQLSPVLQGKHERRNFYDMTQPPSFIKEVESTNQKFNNLPQELQDPEELNHPSMCPNCELDFFFTDLDSQLQA